MKILKENFEKGAAHYILYSALSGCVWSIVACAIGYWIGPILIGGIVLSPLIGIIMGLLYLPAYRLPKIGQVFVSLLTFYLAVSLFGLGIGLYDAFWQDIPNRYTGAVIIEAVLASLWGVTFLGLFVLLWPLSYFNHRILSHFVRDA